MLELVRSSSSSANLTLNSPAMHHEYRVRQLPSSTSLHLSSLSH